VFGGMIRIMVKCVEFARLVNIGSRVEFNTLELAQRVVEIRVRNRK
jgi:hypothetical protein